MDSVWFQRTIRMPKLPSLWAQLRECTTSSKFCINDGEGEIVSVGRNIIQQHNNVQQTTVMSASDWPTAKLVNDPDKRLEMIPEFVQKLLAQFDVQHEVLEKVRDDMLNEFSLGLQYGKTDTSSIAMLPTYVPELPDLAIDLSGKNLRIMLLTLSGNKGEAPEISNHNFMIHRNVMTGTGDQLFNFIVNCLHKFLKDRDLLDANLPVGFVFSYPCELLSIRSARLLWWTKGFDIQDCLQKDVTIKARVKAVMNDTVGQLASAGYKYGADCVIGVVIGYGCNSSYLEDVSKIKKFDAQRAGYKFPKMVVVTEWEEFGARGELDNIMTEFDKQIDEASVHKGKQIIDKLTGALYLGELVRIICSQLVVEGLLFGGHTCDRLETKDGFPSKYISEILADDGVATNFKDCRRVMDELEVPIHGSGDYLILKEICYAVSLRSASIAAAAIAALLKHMGRSKVQIGVGGALIQFHPIYHKLLEEKLATLAPENVNWQIVRAEEGGGQGAALVAAIADKLKL